MPRNKSEKEPERGASVPWVGAGGPFAIATGGHHGPGSPGLLTMAIMRPAPPARPSAWMWECPNCERRISSTARDDRRCHACGTAAPMLTLRHGALWGHEWAAVVRMHQAQIRAQNLAADFDEYRDENPDYRWLD